MNQEDLRTLIDDEGYFRGSEVMWNIEDVEMIAQQQGYEISEEDQKRVLIASLQDNTWLMEEINMTIRDTMDWMIKQGELKPLSK